MSVSMRHDLYCVFRAALPKIKEGMQFAELTIPASDEELLAILVDAVAGYTSHEKGKPPTKEREPEPEAPKPTRSAYPDVHLGNIDKFWETAEIGRLYRYSFTGLCIRDLQMTAAVRNIKIEYVEPQDEAVLAEWPDYCDTAFRVISIGDKPERKCAKCGTSENLSDYHNICEKCEREVTEQWRKDHADELTAYKAAKDGD